MFGSKVPAAFAEINDFSLLVALTNGFEPPFTVTSLQEFPADSSKEDKKAFISSLSERLQRGYLPANCGVYPRSRMVRTARLETPNKARGPKHFLEMLREDFRVKPEEYGLNVLFATDGEEFNLDHGGNMNDIIFAGAKHADLKAIQEDLVDINLYPRRLELGTLSTLAAIRNYCQLKQLTAPTLVLEMTAGNSNVFIFRDEKIDISRPVPYGLNSMFPVIQRELGLKDEEGARKLFYSNTFDFTEMGPQLLKRLLKELQASTGFYEVQTGQTIGQIFITLLPKNFNWIHKILASELAVDILNVDYGEWLRSMNISVGEDIQLESLGSRWFGLFGLMGRYQRATRAAARR